MPFAGTTRVGAAKESAAGGETGDFGSGDGNSFKPWFVLKPSEDSEGPEAEGTIAVESTVLRRKGFEFGGGLELCRPLIAQDGATWQWA